MRCKQRDLDERPYFCFLISLLIWYNRGERWSSAGGYHLVCIQISIQTPEVTEKRSIETGRSSPASAPSAFSNVFWFAPIYRGFSFQFPLFFIAVLHGIRIRGTFWKAVALFFARFSYGKNRKMRPIHLPAPEDADVRNRRLF